MESTIGASLVLGFLLTGCQAETQGYAAIVRGPQTLSGKLVPCGADYGVAEVSRVTPDAMTVIAEDRPPRDLGHSNQAITTILKASTEAGQFSFGAGGGRVTTLDVNFTQWDLQRLKPGEALVDSFLTVKEAGRAVVLPADELTSKLCPRR
jgi:hypothetical protein